MNDYLIRINKFISSLDNDRRDAFENISCRKQFKKGDFLLRQSDVCRFSFLIEQGIARKYYRKGDKEVTTELYLPDDIAISFGSYTLQRPSREFIQAIEHCTVQATNYHGFQQLKKLYPELLELDLMMTEYHAMFLEERLFQFHTLDATQRYLHLINEQPYLLQKVQLTFIASYLGISLETLSRIRANI